jgi:hypothetical protein
LDKTVFSSVLILLILGKSLPIFLIKKLKKKGEEKRKNLGHYGQEFINQKMLKFIKYGLVGTLPHPDLVGDLVYTPFVLHGNQNCFSQFILKQFCSTLEHLRAGSQFSCVFFGNPTNKTVTGTANTWELLIANHLDQSL